MDRLDALNRVREEIDKMLFQDSQVIHNEDYFNREVMRRITGELDAMNLASVRSDRQIITRLIVKEYTNQYNNYKFHSA